MQSLLVSLGGNTGTVLKFNGTRYQASLTGKVADQTVHTLGLAFTLKLKEDFYKVRLQCSTESWGSATMMNDSGMA